MAVSVIQRNPWNNEAQQRRSRQTQEKLLLATERLLARKPFREISILDITRKAHASTSSFYQRFGDKAGLLGCLFQRYAEREKKRLDELLAVDRWKDVPLAQTLRETFPEIIAGFRENHALIRAFIEHASEDERFHETWNTLGAYEARCIKEIVKARLFEVHHPDPMSGVDHVLDLVYGNIIYELMMRRLDGPKMESKVDHLMRMILTFMGIPDVNRQARGR